MAAHQAVLFDVDGTLVDTNYLHVHAWLRAFADEELPVEAWRIHRCIGMDGTSLLHRLCGDVPDEIGERLKQLHSGYYRETAGLMRPLPGARDLLHRVADLGLQVVLATSAPEDELQLTRQVLDCDDVVSAVTMSGDVDTAKPEPGIIEVALDKAGVGPAQAVFVGDAIWDAQACARAAVRCIGVLSGGVGGDELRAAGVVEVFEGPHALLDHLPDSAIGTLLG
ncbi:HAD family hydrolase [Mycolicibacterium sp. CBMA 226]|uniref:HAD family hydrolase n=1 Tax=Mycolicibacterium sp. CBMA 226 TaxID=2606611 RepID=UPI0012DCBC95|nr:HAD family hydrolase [Mycolicibacterium sp. CBMA 226]MUL77102.1 HAD family hydrolase [Mycolicibacterium sp. CBMA 226]